MKIKQPYAYQAIRTKRCGDIVSASCCAGRLKVQWDEGETDCTNHRRAAAMLADRLQWAMEGLHSGVLTCGDYVHVLEYRDSHR